MLPGPITFKAILPLAAVTLLSGCTVVPNVSLPITFTKADRGQVVSLRNVSQMGSGPIYRTARSQPAQQWNRAVAPSAPVVARRATNSYQQQYTPPATVQTQPVQRQAVAVRSGLHQEALRRAVANQEQAVPLLNGQIRQVTQQSSPPLVIQWGDHQQSTGATRTTRTARNFEATLTPFPSPMEALPPATEEPSDALAMPEPCPPGTLPATSQQMGDGCGESTTKKSVDFEQMAKLIERVESMEAELKTSQDSITTLNDSLAAAQTEIAQLKKDVGFWQSEVVRLEQSMQAQHRSDIASLNRISKVLETLLESDVEEMPTPIQDGPPPQFDVAQDPFAPIRN